MAQGLSVSRVVDVQVNFTPQAIPTQRFDTLLIMGDSGVVDTGEAIREYNSIADVAGDFTTTAPEYLAALLFFSQVPQPSTCYIGEWANTPTKGRLTGGLLTSNQMLMSNWTTITNGSFGVSIDGAAAVQVTGLNFTTATNMNAVASTIQTTMRTATSQPLLTFTWNGTQFVCQSGTTGPTSAVAYFTAPTGGGTNISGVIPAPPGTPTAGLMMSSSTAIRSVNGIPLETPVASVVRVDGRGWYAVTFAASRVLTDVEHIAISAYIEAAADKHMYGITTNEQTCLDPVNVTDIGSQAMLADYMRTVIQWSLYSPYAICSFFGRALTVNFEGSNTTLTMKFKVEPGATPEVLSGQNASTLAAKRINTYVEYNNGAAITQEGVMSGRAYFNEMHGLDWLSNRIQNDLFNVLYTSPKIPQTNPGVHVLVTTCDNSLSQGVQNGLLAPGIWNAPGFGELHQGDTLHNGFYTFANNVDTQSQADREARIAPLIQIAAKLAGAIHFVDVLINVNR
jgi:hypothetical protein